METIDNATPTAVIKHKRDSVSVTLSELSNQDTQSFNIIRSNSSNIHSTNREGIYNDNNSNSDIADPLHQGLSNPLPIKNTGDIFGHPRTWAESLADESLLRGTSNNVYHSHSVTTEESSFQTGMDTTLESSQSLSVISPNNSNNTAGSVKFVNATMELLQNQMKREEGPKKKRTRTTSDQLRILQKAFNVDPMPSATARIALAKKLGMSPRAVQVWFQNRRAKGKLDQKRSELVANTIHTGNPNASICKNLNSLGNPGFIKGSSAAFMHPIQPSNQSNIHSLHPMLLGTTTAPILCHGVSTNDTLSQPNIFVNLPHSIAPIYMGSRSQSITSTNSIDINRYNNTSMSGYKHILKSQDHQSSSTMNSQSSIDDQYTNNVVINNGQIVTSNCMSIPGNNCSMSEQISQDSNVDRCDSVSFYHLDNNCFIPSQGYSIRTRASIPHYNHNSNNVMLTQPVGLGLENLNDIENMNTINSYHSQSYNIDHSMMNTYLLQSHGNAYTYNNTLPKSYLQNFQYPSNTTVNFDSIDESKHNNTSEQEGTKMDHNDQRMFIQMADIVPPSVGGWQQLSTDTHSNTNPAFGRSYSLPSQTGSTIMLGSLNHQNLLFPSHMNQMMNTNHTSNAMNWPQMMATRSINSTFDSESQIYSNLAHTSDQHIESKNNSSNTKQSNHSKFNIDTSEQILTPVNDMIMNNSCDDVINDNSFSINGKRGKRSISTPSISSIDTKIMDTCLSTISESCSVTSLSWDKTCTSTIDAPKQYQQESSIATISGPITPEELVTQRRMSRSSFSTLQSDTAIDLNKYVQLDASLVLPVGVQDLMAEGLDLISSNYHQNDSKVDYQ